MFLDGFQNSIALPLPLRLRLNQFGVISGILFACHAGNLGSNPYRHIRLATMVLLRPSCSNDVDRVVTCMGARLENPVARKQRNENSCEPYVLPGYNVQVWS